jgi:hypothetical protein
MRGTSPGEAFGGYIVPGGDLDGDGWDDLVVNSPGEMEAWPEWYDEGVGDVPFHARVVFGPFEGDVLLDEARTLDIDLGAVESSATHDLTGDGLVDVMINSALFEGPLGRGHESYENAGSVYAFDGDYTRYQYVPTPVSDLDGDGVADLVVNDGVIQGPLPSGVYSANDVDWRFAFPEHVDRVNGALDLGDVAGRGVGTVAFYTYAFAEFESLVSGVDIEHPDLLDPLFKLSYESDAIPAVDRAVDLNGDIVDDLVIASTSHEGSSSVDVWYGPLAGTLEQGRGDATVVMPDGVWIGSAGWAGDHDGDGTEDLLIGWNRDEAASGAWLLLGGR